eukprot:7743857-Pyramimonas_sp.AAC.2
MGVIGVRQVCGRALRPLLADDLQPVPLHIPLQDHLLLHGGHQRAHVHVRPVLGHAHERALRDVRQVVPHGAGGGHPGGEPAAHHPAVRARRANVPGPGEQ